MVHKGIRHYSGAEAGNINLGQGGWVHATPVANDIFYSNSSFDNVKITGFADGPAGNTSDTYVTAPDHGFVAGDKILINNSVGYDDGDVNKVVKANGFTITNPGAYTSAEVAGGLAVLFSSPGGGGVVATANCNISGTTPNIKLTGFVLTNQGSGYSSAPTLTFTTAGGGDTATATASLTEIPFSGETHTVANVTKDRFSIAHAYTAEVPVDVYTRRADKHATPAKSSEPNLYYDDIDFFAGIKCFPTVDGTVTTGNAPLLSVEITPLDTNLIDQSSADAPGSDIPLKLQGGQTIFGAFKKIKVVSAVACTMALYKG